MEAEQLEPRLPTAEELMALPRAERRRLQRLNPGLPKIPGSNAPYVK